MKKALAYLIIAFIFLLPIRCICQNLDSLKTTVIECNELGKFLKDVKIEVYTNSIKQSKLPFVIKKTNDVYKIIFSPYIEDKALAMKHALQFISEDVLESYKVTDFK